MSTDEALFNQILEQSKRPEFASLVTVDENERQDIQEFVQELKQREEYYSNCDVEHLGRKLLDRDEMSFLTKQLSVTCPHIPRFTEIIAAFDYVMPEPVQSTSFTEELYTKALEDLSYLIQDEFLFTQDEDHPLDNIVPRSSDLDSSSVSTLNESAAESSRFTSRALQESTSEIVDARISQYASPTNINDSALPAPDATLTCDQIDSLTASELDCPPAVEKTEVLEVTSQSPSKSDSAPSVADTESPSPLGTPIVSIESQIITPDASDQRIVNPISPTEVTLTKPNEDRAVVLCDAEVAIVEESELDNGAADAVRNEIVYSQAPRAEGTTAVQISAHQIISSLPEQPVHSGLHMAAKSEDQHLCPDIRASGTTSPVTAAEVSPDAASSDDDLAAARRSPTSVETQQAVAPEHFEPLADNLDTVVIDAASRNDALSKTPAQDYQEDTQPIEAPEDGRPAAHQAADALEASMLEQPTSAGDENTSLGPQASPSDNVPPARIIPPATQEITKITASDMNDSDNQLTQHVAASVASSLSVVEVSDSMDLLRKFDKTPAAVTTINVTPEIKTDENSSTPASRGRTLTLFNGVGPEACAADGMDWRLEQILRRRAQMCLAEAASVQVSDANTPPLDLAKIEVAGVNDNDLKAITARLPSRRDDEIIQRAESCPPDWCREVFEKAERRRYQRSSSETRRHWNPLICADMTSEWRRDRLRKAAVRKSSPSYTDSPNGAGLYQFDSHLQEVYDKIKSRRLKKTLVQDEGYQLSKQVPDREDLRIAGPKSPPAHLLSRIDSSGTPQVTAQSPANQTTKDDADNSDIPPRTSSTQNSPPRILVSPTRAAAALAVLQGSIPVIPSFNGDIASAPTKAAGAGGVRRKPKPVLVAATATTESNTSSPEIKDFRNILKKTGRLETVLKKSAGAGAVRAPEIFEDASGAAPGPSAPGQNVPGEKRAQLIQDQPVRPSDVRALFEKKARENDASGAEEKEWWLKQVHKYNKR